MIQLLEKYIKNFDILGEGTSSGGFVRARLGLGPRQPYIHTYIDFIFSRWPNNLSADFHEGGVTINYLRNTIYIAKLHG
jgi:hypothetical protein